MKIIIHYNLKGQILDIVSINAQLEKAGEKTLAIS